MTKLIIYTLVFLISIANTFAQERKILDLNYTLTQELDLIEEDIFSASSFSLNHNNVLAIYDLSGNQIVTKDLNSGVLNSFQLKEGRGPGEIQSVWDIEINNLNTIVLSDKDKFKFIEFKTDGTFIREYTPKNKYLQPFRINLCNESGNLFAISGQMGVDGFLHRIDSNGNSLAVFEKVTNPNIESVFFTDGNIFCDDKDNLYYTSFYTNIIRKYSPEGNIKFEREVFGFKPNEQIIVKEGRFTSLNPKARKASGELYVVDNFLVIGYSNRRDRKLVALDYYDKNTGEYSHTFPFSKLVHYFAINDDYLITVTYDRDWNYFMDVYKSMKAELTKND